MANRKIINAEGASLDGIHFRSGLEIRMYKLLQESGLDFKYEPTKIVLMEGFYPNENWYDRSTKMSEKIRAITYTPDFVVYKDGEEYAYIEMKGFANDSWPIKKKLLLNKLHLEGSKIQFFEVHSKKDELTHCIDTIKKSIYESVS